MKKLLLGIAILLAGLVALKIWMDFRKHQQQAIVAVLEQANRTRTQQIKLRNGTVLTVHPGDLRFSWRIHNGSLFQIPTTECPLPFQEAWLNFIQVRERAADPVTALAPIAEFGVSIVNRDPSTTKDALSRLDKTNPQEAWMRVQAIALRYGVQIRQQGP